MSRGGRGVPLLPPVLRFFSEGAAAGMATGGGRGLAAPPCAA